MYPSKKLTIFSDTLMCKNELGSFSFGPVVRELEHVEHLFDEITWVGYANKSNEVDVSMIKINSPKIKLILFKSIGGKGIFSFINILLQYPKMFFVILNQIQNTDIVHTRAPSHPALIAIIISFFYKKNKIWWNKYAGDWGQKNPPLSYGFQRNLLKIATFSNVTINGFWINQPNHCYSFENPCLTQKDIEKGKIIASKKNFSQPFIFCFAGRFDEVKGISILLNALKALPSETIEKIHLIGDGQMINNYKLEAKELGNKVIFHGFLQKNELHEFIANSHFLLLPSKAEGFPKVVAEAACYGTIPIVSDVGSITHYINEKNGFVWEINGAIPYYTRLFDAVSTTSDELQLKSKQIIKLAQLFTFQNYNYKLQKLVFKESKL